MPDGVLPRPAFAVFGGRTGASERVAPIGFDLSERGHGLVGRSVTMEATFSEIAAAIRYRHNRMLRRKVWRDCRRGLGISING